jgi:hypothetical protein
MTGMSMQALLDAHPRDYGVSETRGMVVYVEPGEGKTDAIGLTYNTESIYTSMSLDLKQTGPAGIAVGRGGDPPASRSLYPSVAFPNWLVVVGTFAAGWREVLV